MGDSASQTALKERRAQAKAEQAADEKARARYAQKIKESKEGKQKPDKWDMLVSDVKKGLKKLVSGASAEKATKSIEKRAIGDYE